MSATQCEICGELLDCPENDFGDGESLGHALDCPVPLGGGAHRYRQHATTFGPLPSAR